MRRGAGAGACACSYAAKPRRRRAPARRAEAAARGHACQQRCQPQVLPRRVSVYAVATAQRHDAQSRYAAQCASAQRVHDYAQRERRRC